MKQQISTFQQQQEMKVLHKIQTTLNECPLYSIASVFPRDWNTTEIREFLQQMEDAKMIELHIKNNGPDGDRYYFSVTNDWLSQDQ